MAVRVPEFLNVRPEIEIPLILMERDSQVNFDADKKENDMNDSNNDELFLTNPLGRFEPIIIRCERNHQNDITVARKILAPIFATRDVLEPFDRIETALEAVHREESSRMKRKRE